MGAEWLALHFSLSQTPRLEEFSHPFPLSTQGVDGAFGNFTSFLSVPHGQQLSLCEESAVLSMGHLKDNYCST